jgi:sialate O-acetylesterase
MKMIKIPHNRKLINFVGFTSLMASTSFAAVQPNALFTDGAVFQRGQAIPVWGKARDGESITVSLQDQKLQTKAVNGKWRVDLKPMKEGGPYTMSITGDNTVTINNLLIGEVWICSGQSNMEWPFSRSHNQKEEAPKADYPNIRMFTVKKSVAAKPKDNVIGSWDVCTPKSVMNFSGVGYFFARDIHLKLGVPVGMIHTSWGGTPAQAWTSAEGLAGDPELKEYTDAVQRKLSGYDAAAATYKTMMTEYQALQNTWNETIGNPYQAELKAWNVAVAEAKKTGNPEPSKPILSKAQPKPPGNPEGGPHDPTSLYNAMIAPIIPYAIKGSIWYQGESNATKSRQYRTLFPKMVADWRARWKQGDFPFLYVQIAPYHGQPPEIREAQFLSLKKIENSAMAVTTDVGNAKDIHPNQKEPVGQRLALAARAMAYSEKIEYSGPLYEKMTRENDQIVLHFQHASKLVAKDGALKGFLIAGKDKTFVPAKAEIKGNNVIVSAPGITEPQAVRYGWNNVPDVNLFNQEGLPASPFRTDVE